MNKKVYIYENNFILGTKRNIIDYVSPIDSGIDSATFEQLMEELKNYNDNDMLSVEFDFSNMLGLKIYIKKYKEVSI